MNKLRLLPILLLVFKLGWTQVAKEVNPPDYIKTIQFLGNSSESQLPIIKLGDVLRLEFDAVNNEEADFYYTIEHFNYDWTPSILVKSEYLNGIDNQRIRDYLNSYNTYQIYSHYMLQIPNEQTRGLLVSGNYMIKVYDDYGDLVFSRKFMVYEDKVGVGVAIKRSRDVRFINEKQSVDIAITSNAMPINNPMQTIKTLIIQNNNLNTAISGLKPQYTIGNQLIYNYTKETTFWAGNEYLFFETKDLRVATLGTQYIDLKDLYHNYLHVDVPRAQNPYTYNPDINGNFVITAVNAQDLSIEADYAWIHFRLEKEPFLDKEVYVYGNFNNYALGPDNKMTYDPSNQVYTASIKLKQGFYNYKYVVVDQNGNLDEGAISGNYYQTENNYKVLVFYRDLGALYDRIIGLGEGSSINISN